MDPGSRNTASGAAIGLIGALIGAIGTVAAAYINLLKPSEKQIESSEQYRTVQMRLTQLEQSLQLARRAAPAASPERISNLEALNARLQAENSQLHGRIASLELETKRLVVAATSSSPPPITKPSPAPEPKSNASPDGPQQRTPYSVTIGAVTRTQDGTTISLWALREYAGGQLGANFYVDGKSGQTHYPGQRIVVRRTREAECYFDVLSLEGSDKAPSTAKANVEYTCAKL